MSELGWHTIGRIIRHNAQAYPKREAFVDAQDRWTWAEADDQSDVLVSRLIALGISRGDRVVTLARNSVRLILLNYALAKIGAIMVPLNYWLRKRELLPLIENAAPSLFVYDHDNASAIEQIVGDVCESIRWAALTDQVVAGLGQSLFDDQHPRATLANLEPVRDSDPYMLIYTSGTTTGKPKAVVRTHRMAYLNAVAAAQAFSAQENDCIVLYTPNFHVSFWDSQMQFVCLSAGKVAVLDRFDAADVLSTVSKEGVTIVFGIGTTMRELVVALESGSRALVAGVRLVILPARVEAEFLHRVSQAFGLPVREVRNGWGMTETGPYVVFLNGEDWLSHPGASGRESIFCETAIVDDAGERVATGTVGEILVRGATVAESYWSADDATSEAFVGGWLHTGDLGWKDEDGLLYFFDRKKAVIKRGGENVSALEVEEYLLQHPAVKEVAVIPVPDPHWGETGLAIVVTNMPHDESTRKSILEYAVSGLAGFKVPQHVEFVDELPTVSIGKVAKSALVAEYSPRYESKERLD